MGSPVSNQHNQGCLRMGHLEPPGQCEHVSLPAWVCVPVSTSTSQSFRVTWKLLSSCFSRLDRWRTIWLWGLTGARYGFDPFQAAVGSASYDCEAKKKQCGPTASLQISALPSWACGCGRATQPLCALVFSVDPSLLESSALQSTHVIPRAERRTENTEWEATLATTNVFSHTHSLCAYTHTHTHMPSSHPAYSQGLVLADICLLPKLILCSLNKEVTQKGFAEGCVFCPQAELLWGKYSW